MDFKSVGILMIATNDYIERWKSVACDLEINAFIDIHTVTIHLFTNEVEKAQSFAESHIKRIKVLIHEIEGWGWPEATLLRYKFFNEFSELVNEDFLVYLDSDMRVVGDFSPVTKILSAQDGVGVVQHPGYFRPSGLERIKIYLKLPRMALSDFKVGMLNSWSLGAWETNKSSQAFVPRSERAHYVHGAIWFGFRSDFLRLCATLAERIELDLAKGYIALWHDESHLNNYITNNPHRIIDNRLSYVFDYPQLKRYSETYLISNVEKDPGEGRNPTSE